MDLSNFFFRQKVTHDDLNQFRDDADKAVRNVEKAIHGRGVASGINVTATNPADNVLHLAAGVAFDLQGQRINVANPATKNVTMASLATSAPGLTRFMDVYLEFVRVDSDLRIDGNNQQVYYRSSESFQTTLAFGAESANPVPPAAPSADAVLIARVTGYNGMTAIQDSDIDNSVRVDISAAGSGSGSAFWADPVKSRSKTTPDGGETNGQRFIVHSPATGAWAGKETQIATKVGGSWSFEDPQDGLTVFCESEDQHVTFHDVPEGVGSWSETAGGSSGAVSTGFKAPVDFQAAGGAPPGSPTNGMRYLINNGSPSGAWAGHAWAIAQYDVNEPGGWAFEATVADDLVYVRSDRAYFRRMAAGYSQHNIEMSWAEFVIDVQTAPPGAPLIGDRYIVDTPATGAWVGFDGMIAEWNGAAWVAHVEPLKTMVWVENQKTFFGRNLGLNEWQPFRRVLETMAFGNYKAAGANFNIKTTGFPLLVAKGLANDPPATPDDGDVWLVGEAPTGAWVGFGRNIATWSYKDLAWKFAHQIPPGTAIATQTDLLRLSAGGWTNAGDLFAHNSLTGQDGGVGSPAERYHMTKFEHREASKLPTRRWVKNQAASPPGSPAVGDRYYIIGVATGAWTGLEGMIAEWNGAAWDMTAVEKNQIVYSDDGARWLRKTATAGDNIEVLESKFQHGALAAGSIQGGRSNELYHLTLGQHNVATRDFVGYIEAIQDAPPGSPGAGLRWIVGGSPSGAWVGHANEIAEAAAVNPGNPWWFSFPRVGTIAMLGNDSSRLYRWDGTNWVTFTASATQPGLMSTTDKVKLDAISQAVNMIGSSFNDTTYTTPAAAGDGTAMAASTVTVAANKAPNKIIVQATARIRMTVPNGVISQPEVRAEVTVKDGAGAATVVDSISPKPGISPTCIAGISDASLDAGGVFTAIIALTAGTHYTAANAVEISWGKIIQVLGNNIGTGAICTGRTLAVMAS